MLLREQILKEHSKANCDRIVKWIGDSQPRFDELFKLFINGEPLVKQRAGWPLSYAVRAHPRLIHKHLGKLLKNLRQPNLHNAIVRNTMRLLETVDVPEKYQGELMDACFNYINDPAEKVAIKAFSLTVLENLSKQYPEIRQELRTIIEDRWDSETAAFRSRARKILFRMK